MARRAVRRDRCVRWRAPLAVPPLRSLHAEIDDESLRWAAANVELNGRVERVELVQTRAGEPLLAPFHNSPSFKCAVAHHIHCL